MYTGHATSEPNSAVDGFAMAAHCESAIDMFPLLEIDTHVTVRVRTPGPHVAFHALHAPGDHAIVAQPANCVLSTAAGLALTNASQ